MKKLCTTLIMTIVVTVPFSNILAADSKKNYKALDLPEEDAWIMRMEEMKKTGKGRLVAEDLLRFINSRIHESEQVIFVDVRKKCDKKFEYWTEGYYTQFNQSSQKFEQSKDENECLNMLIDSLYARIDEGEYSISQFNLATLEDITDGKFVGDFEHRYVRYHAATGILNHTILADQFLEYISALSSDNTIHIHCLPAQETNTTIFFLHDTIKEEKMEYNPLKNKYLSRYTSEGDISVYESGSMRSSFVNSRSESLYDKLNCGHSTSGGISYSWGGNEPPQGSVYIKTDISDNNGNSIQGGFTCDNNGRSTVNVDYREKERDRNH